MQVLLFFSKENFETFDILHAFLLLTNAKLSTLKTVQFLAHPVDRLSVAWTLKSLVVSSDEYSATNRMNTLLSSLLNSTVVVLKILIVWAEKM